MTKLDIALKITSAVPNVLQQDVQLIVQKTLDCISEAIGSGNSVELRNFGVFSVKRRMSRMGRNPKQPTQQVTIPERMVVRFKPGKDLKQALEKLVPTTATIPVPENEVPAAV